MLIEPCKVGDILSLKVINNGDGYSSETVNVTVTGAGYDKVGDIVLHSPPLFLNITIDDELNYPDKEIDLNAGGTKEVKCAATIQVNDEVNLISTSAVLFDVINSSLEEVDDNNNHYTNSSCMISYVDPTRYHVECGMNIWYYSNSGEWNCTMNIVDKMGSERMSSNTTHVNTLLAISLPNILDYGYVTPKRATNESILNITNLGNTKINISIEGFGEEIGDELSMNCTIGNISIENHKYNLTESNHGELNLYEFESRYHNLTSNPIIRGINFNFRNNDEINDARMQTYWRIYVPSGVTGSCTGNILVGARIGSEE
jgi:hypothetical protein